MKTNSITKAFSELATQLNAIGNQKRVFASPFYLKQYEELHQVTSALKGEKLLDWGAGYGHFGFVQAKLGKKVDAYSPAEDEYTEYTSTLELLSEKAPFEYQLSTEPILLPYNDEDYDIAVSCGVLEHVREFGGDDVKSLSELYRILKKGGYLVIGHLPNTGSWIESYSRKSGRPCHTFLYTNNEVKEKVKNAGFRIVKHKRYGILPKNTIAVKLLRFSNRKGMVRLLAKCVYGADRYFLSPLLPWFAQNHLVILQKPK